MQNRRVIVINPSDGGVVYWIVKLYAFSLVVGLSALGFVGLGLYLHFSRQLPPLPDLSNYAKIAPGITTLVGQDGTMLAEFSTERREIVPLDRIPQPLVDAFVATEDRRFFSHSGLDLRGTGRALLANMRAGQVMQGGSTITQQVAKAFLSSERSLSRKIKEAIFARRLEARYSKREILALYLNHIFLGNGAFGVQAAAHRYFDRDVWDLDVSEMAMIAGLARAPSRYSPLVDIKAATDRRATVLDNMVETGVVTKLEAERAKTMPMLPHVRRDFFHEVSPYFSEHVRRDLVKRFGQKGFYEGGYRVETTVLPYLDVLAQDNVDYLARKLDKRQGWRGPEAHLSELTATEFRKRAAQYYGDGPLKENKLYLGLVEQVNPHVATVRVGGHNYSLPIENMNWAAKYSREATNDHQISSATDALRKLDVIWVRQTYRSNTPRFTEFVYSEAGDAEWLPEQKIIKRPKTIELSLEQTPRVQGAIYSYDHENGYVLSMAGGDDFDRSEFNRVTQACRQPGSSYKPIYYSLALDRGYSFDTQWNDKPKAQIDPDSGEQVMIQNIDGSYSNSSSLERALVWSKNPPSVEIFQILGSQDVESWAHKLGLSTPLISNPKCEQKFCPALALGASCVKLNEITNAFSVFAKNGVSSNPITVKRVIDRQGHVIEDHTALDDPWISAGNKLDRIAAVALTESEPIIEPRTAYLTTKLLREIVTTGHSAPIRATKLPAAGKTGTSSNTWDVWFVGFTSRWMTTAWIGDELHERQLGYKDASFSLSVPMWARYMATAVGDQPLSEIPWSKPAGVKENDRGGPLKKQFPPPPTIGLGLDGKPVNLPARLVAPPASTVLQVTPAPARRP